MTYGATSATSSPSYGVYHGQLAATSRSQHTCGSQATSVLAVDSEHSENVNIDLRRAAQVLRYLSKPGHDFGKFGTGNKKTLLDDPQEKGIHPREALLEFSQRSGTVLTCE
ncbi:hypothetical protein COOONC_01185 [Cooperia oncophora]